MTENLSHLPPFVLASGSPRRRQLLEEAQCRFEVIPPDDGAECGFCSGESPIAFVARQAFLKTQDVARRFQQGLYLGADTVAECDGQILGKPRDEDHARRMLEMMRGKSHFVHTGVVLWHRPSDQQIKRTATSRLVMAPLTDAQIDEHIESNAWIGKAGAFGFQDGINWVHLIDGSVENVVGLPLEILSEMFKQFSDTKNT
jgi:septum formation protein